MTVVNASSKCANEEEIKVISEYKSDFTFKGVDIIKLNVALNISRGFCTNLLFCSSLVN